MSYHYDQEQQACTPEMIQTDEDLLSRFRIISPVTLSERWHHFY